MVSSDSATSIQSLLKFSAVLSIHYSNSHIPLWIRGGYVPISRPVSRSVARHQGSVWVRAQLELCVPSPLGPDTFDIGFGCPASSSARDKMTCIKHGRSSLARAVSPANHRATPVHKRCSFVTATALRSSFPIPHLSCFSTV